MLRAIRKIPTRLSSIGLGLSRLLNLMWAVNRPEVTRGTSASQALSLRDRCRYIVKTHGIKIEVLGHPPEHACILVANHLGYLDPVLICAIQPCLPVAKIELMGWPLLGSSMRRLGVIFVERDCAWSGAQVLRRIRRLVEAENSTLIFPEGTTSDGTRVLTFKRGVFGLSKRLRVPICPVTIDFEDRESCWLDDDSFVRHYGVQSTKPISKVTLTFHPLVNACTDETAEEFAARVKSIIECDLRGVAVDIHATDIEEERKMDHAVLTSMLYTESDKLSLAQ